MAEGLAGCERARAKIVRLAKKNSKEAALGANHTTTLTRA